MHNPIRHVGHAVEELSESLWHLDGRVFRTRRDLLAPARVACGYLAGHRTRYIAPLRLFVILSVLTFFVGKMKVDFGNAMQVDGVGNSIATPQTVAEVERRGDAALAGLARARGETATLPVVATSLQATQALAREQAAARIAKLDGDPPVLPSGDTDLAAAAGTATPTLRFGNAQPWNAQTNPLTLRWLPAAANDWLNHKIGRALAKAPRLQHDEALRRQLILGSAATALFVLMPMFALLLKLSYLRSGRLYLEHLVVALYSHACLLLALIFLPVGLEHTLVPRMPGTEPLFGGLQGALWWAMPVYLLIMQKRVYGQGWGTTAIKYGALGTVHVTLVALAALIAGFAGLAQL